MHSVAVLTCDRDAGCRHTLHNSFHDNTITRGRRTTRTAPFKAVLKMATCSSTRRRDPEVIVFHEPAWSLDKAKRRRKTKDGKRDDDDDTTVRSIYTPSNTRKHQLLFLPHLKLPPPPPPPFSGSGYKSKESQARGEKEED